MNLRDELQAIYDTRGKLTPEIVVEEARPKGSPLHTRVFDKDESEAAEAYYRNRAHEIIQSVKITYTSTTGEPQSIRAFHSVRQDNGHVFEPLDVIVKDEVKLKLVLADMKREWSQLKGRYDSFSEFWKMVSEDIA
jgi:hypothetical protein